ncbi:MAG: NifB/NifX family molybdenum-iron cluster-binding protein [Thermodesulfobacteriota bacterium]|nr:NifB/NifX family molybdenum-iron cluster-binding protein [Thermodesulfobacteriota bacterium]
MKRMLFIRLAILFLCPVMVNAGEPEKIRIAVAANGKSTQASVSNMAAKCPYYLIFNNKGELIEVVDNPYRDASGGAGPSAANFLAGRSITIVISGNFGSKMVNTLGNKSVTHFEFKGVADNAVKKVLKLN